MVGGATESNWVHSSTHLSFLVPRWSEQAYLSGWFMTLSQDERNLLLWTPKHGEVIESPKIGITQTLGVGSRVQVA